jgi:stearoyl-CoA desaturase (delta-9 desaturase)
MVVDDKYLCMFSSTSSSLIKIQLLTGLLSVVGIFYLDFSIIHVLLAITSFYVYSILGLSMTLHRYYTHKSFEMNSILHWIFTFISILTGRGSPIGWVYVHRLHHAFSDTDKDPHGPKTIGFKLFGFKPIEHKFNAFIVKDLMNASQIFINKYYLLIILCWLILLSIIDINLVYFTWILPVFMVQLSQNSFNYFAHKYGYRNFETKDNSTNNIWLWPFILGDAWHNNHHGNSEKFSTKIKKYEFDPVSNFINFIKK